MALAKPAKILVVSPHLDDAVFSAANLIAHHPGTVVATVFAGIPDDFELLTEWDAASGFENARQAIAARREEDRSALEQLSAMPLWLDFLDSQYQATPTVAMLADALREAIRQTGPATVLLPAGLFHSDHVLVHQALLCVREHYPEKTWLMYEEAMYRRIPGLLQQRLAALERSGIEATPETMADDATASRKREALHCYASQLRALQLKVRGGYADALAPERYWRLAWREKR